MIYYCHAGVAQSVVHLIRNQKVAGSSPAASSISRRQPKNGRGHAIRLTSIFWFSPRTPFLLLVKCSQICVGRAKPFFQQNLLRNIVKPYFSFMVYLSFVTTKKLTRARHSANLDFLVSNLLTAARRTSTTLQKL